MYQFNGWIVLRYHTYEIDSERQDYGVSKFKHYIKDIDTENVTVFRRNGLDSFMISGMHNHKQDYVVEIFEWVAEHLPGSYGLLYIWDDEDCYGSYSRYQYTDETIDNTNKFLVWKLAKGKLTQVDDPFLSPCIPTIEDEYDSSRKDY